MAAPSKLNCRRLLKSTAKITAVAIGLPYFIPFSAFGKSKISPGERITLGFIGIGKRCRGLLRNFLGIGDFQTVVVCDADSRKRAYACQLVDDK